MGRINKERGCRLDTLHPLARAARSAGADAKRQRLTLGRVAYRFVLYVLTRQRGPYVGRVACVSDNPVTLFATRFSHRRAAPDEQTAFRQPVRENWLTERRDAASEDAANVVAPFTPAVRAYHGPEGAHFSPGGEKCGLRPKIAPGLRTNIA